MCDYPSDVDLEKIKNWSWNEQGGDGFMALMDFIKPRWKWSEPGGWCGWHRKGRTYKLYTGGWSGNEDLIRAMEENFIFWSMCWMSSRRGGAHMFRVPNIKRKANAVTVKRSN